VGHCVDAVLVLVFRVVDVSDGDGGGRVIDESVFSAEFDTEVN